MFPPTQPQQAAQPAARPLPPESQGLINLMMANLAANNAAPGALDAWREARDAQVAQRAAPTVPPR